VAKAKEVEPERPPVRAALPFKVLPGNFVTAEYEGEINVGGRVIRQPYRMQQGPLLDAVLRTLEMYREVERELALAASERDRAMARATNAEAELAQRGGWKKPKE
jgi:hypothetical protein